MQEDMGADA